MELFKTFTFEAAHALPNVRLDVGEIHYPSGLVIHRSGDMNADVKRVASNSFADK